jgi:hypothetical protein
MMKQVKRLIIQMLIKTLARSEKKCGKKPTYRVERKAGTDLSEV